MSDSGELSTSTLSDMRKSLHAQLQKSTKKLERQKEELDDTRKHTWYKEIGDSLLALPPAENRRGNQTLMLLNVYSQSKESVTMNPKLDTKENAALFFKKAKKGKRGFEISLKKVEATQKEIEELSQLQRRCDEILRVKTEPDPLILEKLLLDIKKFNPETQTQQHNEKNRPAEIIPYRHHHIDSWDIYIGKTDTQNDELSIHFAKPTDIWLHVAGHAGSHVVIRRPKNAEMPPKDVIEKAAMMAVWFSKAKHTSYAEVHFTEARFVRKRRHAPPGEVMIDRFKSVRVSPKSPQDIFPSTFLNEENE